MATLTAAPQTRKPARKPLPPVSGVCRWLEHIGSDPDFPRVGVVEINGRRYCLGRHADHYRLIACQPDKQGKIGNYTIPADLSTCECGDFCFRSDRRAAETTDHDGRCKHLKALAKLLAEARILEARQQPVALAS